MDFYRKLKDASIKAAKHSADIIKTVSNDVKAVASSGNMFDAKPNENGDTITNSIINVFTSSQQTNDITNFVSNFRQLCKFIDSIKGNTFHWITNEEAETIRSALKYMISELCSENKMYKGYDYIPRNSNEVISINK